MALKLTILYFLPQFCPKFGPFCNFKSLYNLSMPSKVHIWHCFVCETIFSVHLWIYSVPNGTLASKLKILYFLPPFCPKFCPFCTSWSFHILFMAYTVEFWYCFICTTILSVHLWIYSVPIEKLALKLTIL